MAQSITSKERARKYYLEHCEAIKARVREYAKTNREKISLSRKEYFEGRKEIKREYDKVYFQKNREKKAQQNREWSKNNPDIVNGKMKETSRKWKQSNHDKVMAHWRKRRAIQLDIEGEHFTGKQFKELCEYYENKCLKCGRTDKQLTADHVIPLSLKVPHSDEIENIQPLCRSCNSQKGTKTIDYRKT